MGNPALFIPLLLYPALIFGGALLVERQSRKKKLFKINGFVYALSLGIYCTAWTFYGSIGVASKYSLEYSAVYLGPVLAMPIWWILMRKVIRICKTQNINTLSDFLMARYGKSILVGRWVSVFLLIGIIPYISLQLKAINESVSIMLEGVETTSQPPPPEDLMFYVVLGLALFMLAFTGKGIRDTGLEHNRGLVYTVVFDSILKVVSLLLLSVVLLWVIDESPFDFTTQLAHQPAFQINEENNYGEWLFILLLSAVAFLLLPRQFEMAVAENQSEKHLNTALWLVPLYLLIINLPVTVIALSGNRVFDGMNVLGDNYAIALPAYFSMETLSSLMFTGGLAAAAGMITVSTHSLSKMLNNSVLMPWLLSNSKSLKMHEKTLQVVPRFFRKISIIIILLLAYLYYEAVSNRYTLIYIGFTSFVAVAQLAPAFIGGVYWKGAAKKGALAGIFTGMAIWFYFYSEPVFRYFSEPILQIPTNPGIFTGEVSALVFFFATGANILIFIVVSLFSKPDSVEQNTALLFVDIFNYSNQYEKAMAWKGTAYFKDVENLLAKVLGDSRAQTELNDFKRQYPDVSKGEKSAHALLVNFAEKQLTGALGSSSARVLIRSVVKEEKVELQDVIHILKESSELMQLNKELIRKSKELKQMTAALKRVNHKLKRQDELRDEFLTTVTHELRTPLTGISSLVQILAENDNLPRDLKKQYIASIVKESDRMSRLISQVLDLESFESGVLKVVFDHVQINELLKRVITAQSQQIKEEKVKVHLDLHENIPKIQGDEDRLLQVFLNLVSNAIKFSDTQSGEVWITGYKMNQRVIVKISDNGPGVEPERREDIFKKFVRVRKQGKNHPKGSGLGLAVAKKIIDLHDGKITIQEREPSGSVFIVSLPVEVKWPNAYQ